MSQIPRTEATLLRQEVYVLQEEEANQQDVLDNERRKKG